MLLTQFIVGSKMQQIDKYEGIEYQFKKIYKHMRKYTSIRFVCIVP